MRVTAVALKDFRNFESLRLELGPGLNLLSGDNGQGKTNFLEAVYFCAGGRAIRSARDSELIRFEAREARIQVYFDRNGLGGRADMRLCRDGIKSAAINGLPVRKLGELMQNLFAVVFSPEDLSLVKGGPAERRRFIDVQLCRLSAVYYNDLQQYHKILKQRNALLKEISRDRSRRDSLFVWDGQLADYGARLVEARAVFAEKLGGIASGIHSALSGGMEKLQIDYKPSALPGELIQKLEKNAEYDIMTGTTTAGAHRDELLFAINGREARGYASQGQQRTACLAAVLAEAELISEEKLETPVLILDDALSELDEKRKAYVFNFTRDMQTLVTCAGNEAAAFAAAGAPDSRMFRVENGRVEPVNS